MRFPIQLALALLAVAVVASPALAEEPVDDAARVLLVYSGAEDDATVVESQAPHFQGPVLELATVRFAGDAEKAEIFADCGADLGASPTAVRECRLKAANREYVSEVLELSAARDGRKRWDFTLQVWDPLDNELRFTKVIGADGRSLKAAAKVALPQLAASYVCFRGIERGCSGTFAAQGGGRLEIADVSPNPVTVLINGVEMGPAPNQFTGLPTGEVELVLRQAGYADFTRTIELSDEQVTTLNGLVLEPLPAMLRVSASRADAGIWIDGAHKGTTGPGQEIVIEVAPGTYAVSVGGFGSTLYAVEVELGPGAQRVIEAVIEDATALVEACLAAPTEDACSVACASGDPASCGEYGSFLYGGAGKGAWQDAREAFAFACENGIDDGCNNLAFMTEKGQGGARDPEAARALYDQACTGGVVRACFNLGMLLHSGSGDVVADPKGARAAWDTGCNAGEGRACYQLGDVYFRGDGVAADPAEAAIFFERACDNETLGGCTNLAFLLESGSGVSADVDRAVVLYDKACQGTEPGACYNLGYLYAAGEKVVQDLPRAQELFQRACDAGFQDACKAAKQLR